MTRLRLRVTAAAESILRSGHPWLFAASIREQNREGRLGELAVIYDRHDRFLAIGLYDPDSPIRLRVLHSGKPAELDWKARLHSALDRRMGLFDEQTTGHRWIHGESDGWPGLVLDRYGAVLVLKLYTAAWLPRLDEIAALIAAEMKPATLVLRMSRNIQEMAKKDFGKSDGQVLHGPKTENVVFLESGLRFESDVIRGQKTGFYLDQRENRRKVEALAAGRDVLNAFSFSGGFSVYAARGGAKSVVDLDISAHALEAADRNFALNGHGRHETIQADAFEWLERNSARRFDLVVLDPPSLAKRETERNGAIRAYEKLAGHAFSALRPGGVLVAASCSAHVSAEEFFDAVRRAVPLKQLETTGHPADHPATFAEAKYLKCIYFSEEKP